MTAPNPTGPANTDPDADPETPEAAGASDNAAASGAADAAKATATLLALGAEASAVDLLRGIVGQRPNGEVRPQQEQMVDLVEKAIKNKTHLLVQAGTGTGKSLGYLIPAIHSGKRVIVSTATKQLGEQIINEDMPVLADLIPKVGGDDFTYALIKGRNNYACKREVDSLLRLDGEGEEEVQEALFADPTPRENSRRPSKDDLQKLNSLLKWVDTTQTGDRSEAPAVPDKVWDQISTDAAGCAGRSCPFYDDCFAEIAREQAREAQIVVTNHAQVAQDLISEFPLLGEWEVLVTDEVHELESYLSSAWGLEVAPSAMKHHASQVLRKLPRDDKYVQAREIGVSLLEELDALNTLLAEEPEGLKPDLPERLIAALVGVAKKMRTIMDAFSRAAEERSASVEASAERKGAAKKIAELCESVVAMCADMSSGEQVRWLESGFGNRGPSLKVAPLWIGPTLMTHLADRTLIATSATMTVGGSFDSFIRTLALDERVTNEDGESTPPRKYDAVDVGTPFDYSKQAMLYIPGPDFPAPVGPNREEHTTAVKSEVVSLVQAAGGRTLALFTTRRAAEAAAEHLRSNVDTPVLCQGDAPPSQLIAQFKEDESATLCATMGFWHGVNAPGDTLMCVILDKAPFAPMNDPLMSARRQAVDDAGRRGFDEVYVANASVMLSQGVGRLIRTATDKGVVAILDNRLRSKYYGRTMIASMPPMRIFDDRSVVEGALNRIAAAADTNRPKATSPSSVRQAARTSQAQKAAATTAIPARRAAPKKSSTRALSKVKDQPTT